VDEVTSASTEQARHAAQRYDLRLQSGHLWRAHVTVLKVSDPASSWAAERHCAIMFHAFV